MTSSRRRFRDSSLSLSAAARAGGQLRGGGTDSDAALALGFRLLPRGLGRALSARALQRGGDLRVALQHHSEVQRVPVGTLRIDVGLAADAVTRLHHELDEVGVVTDDGGVQRRHAVGAHSVDVGHLARVDEHLHDVEVTFDARAAEEGLPVAGLRLGVDGEGVEGQHELQQLEPLLAVLTRDGALGARDVLEELLPLLLEVLGPVGERQGLRRGEQLIRERDAHRLVEEARAHELDDVEADVGDLEQHREHVGRAVDGAARAEGAVLDDGRPVEVDAADDGPQQLRGARRAVRLPHELFHSGDDELLLGLRFDLGRLRQRRDAAGEGALEVRGLLLLRVEQLKVVLRRRPDLRQRLNVLPQRLERRDAVGDERRRHDVGRHLLRQLDGLRRGGPVAVVVGVAGRGGRDDLLLLLLTLLDGDEQLAVLVRGDGDGRLVALAVLVIAGPRRLLARRGGRGRGHGGGVEHDGGAAAHLVVLGVDALLDFLHALGELALHPARRVLLGAGDELSHELPHRALVRRALVVVEDVVVERVDVAARGARAVAVAEDVVVAVVAADRDGEAALVAAESAGLAAAAGAARGR
mmetsp:Transcript_26457/g.81754  ORF Transcript_26457/g.81754 Transcript_26457/m.81754 type:complete len:584 (-) Transcript_26457:745-2496(-)